MPMMRMRITQTMIATTTGMMVTRFCTWLTEALRAEWLVSARETPHQVSAALKAAGAEARR